MLVERLGRVGGDARVEEALLRLRDDPDVAFQAGTGIRRRFGPARAVEILEPLSSHSDPRVRKAAREHVKRARRSLSTRAER
jgi:hypothetical protein